MTMQPALAFDIKTSDSRVNNFYMDALKFVLDKSGKTYQLISTNHPPSSQSRKVLLVRQGEIDLLYAGTSAALESELLPIRFPIMRGVIGHRLFIINKALQADLDWVESLEDLRRFQGIQGIGWGDTQVLEAAGLAQEQRLYDRIFVDLDHGSRYYFPRGMTEIYSEISDKKSTLPNLVVESRIVLTYQTAVFFFIRHDNEALAEMLNAGFLKAYQDGSYNDFFYNHPTIKSAFQQANLKSRKEIKIDNPFLTPKTRAIPALYWHQE